MAPSAKASNQRQGTDSFRCRVCRGIHALRKCQRFLKLTPEKRLRAVLINKYCSNCLAHQHSGESCRSGAKCKICKKDHHTLLHMRDPRSARPSRSDNRPTRRASGSSPSSGTSPPSPRRATIRTSLTSLLQHKGVSILPTAIVLLDTGKKTLVTRALIDPCCSVSRINATVARAYGLSVTRIGAEGACTAVLRSKTTQMSREVVLMADPQLSCITPARAIRADMKDPFSNVALADNDWFRPSPVPLVLGADVYPDIILPGILPSQGGLPMAQNTKFGWILSGTCTQ
ncbi:uncharacterized protein LOC135434354 [Drosophila montana]|uniref:uncharacterized protein LOC135434354 n=1 Tax=Drosophila montana TaxID=40370 RepID=UPI00313EFC93